MSRQIEKARPSISSMIHNNLGRPAQAADFCLLAAEAFGQLSTVQQTALLQTLQELHCQRLATEETCLAPLGQLALQHNMLDAAHPIAPAKDDHFETFCAQAKAVRRDLEAAETEASFSRVAV